MQDGEQQNEAPNASGIDPKVTLRRREGSPTGEPRVGITVPADGVTRTVHLGAPDFETSSAEKLETAVEAITTAFPSTKSWLKSKTIWAIFALVGTLWPNLDLTTTGGVVSLFASIVGLVVGIWGRVGAAQALHLVDPAKIPKMDDCGRPTGGTLQ